MFKMKNVLCDAFSEGSHYAPFETKRIVDAKTKSLKERIDFLEKENLKLKNENKKIKKRVNAIF